MVYEKPLKAKVGTRYEKTECDPSRLFSIQVSASVITNMHSNPPVHFSLLLFLFGSLVSLLFDVITTSQVRHMIRDEKVQERVCLKEYDLDGEWSLKVLHLLLKQRAPIDVVQRVIEIDDGQATRHHSQPYHRLPLHDAVLYKGSARKEVIERLLDEFPEAAYRRSFDGNLPLHIACSKRRPIAVIKLLVDGTEAEELDDHPDLRNVLDGSGKTPWEIIKKQSHWWEVVYRNRARKLLKVSGPVFEGFDNDNGKTYQCEHVEFELIPKKRVMPDVPMLEELLPSPPAILEEENGGTNDEMVYEGDRLHSTYETEEKTKMEEGNTSTTSCRTNPTAVAKIDHGRGGQAETNTNGLCVLCWDGVADHCLVPCGHICLCDKCGGRDKGLFLSSLRLKCPVCKKSFYACMKVFHAGVNVKE